MAVMRTWLRRRRTAKLRLLYPDIPVAERAQANYLGALERIAQAPEDLGRVRQW